MKIRIIIDGNYGHYENGAVYPKNKNSEPFELEDNKAINLISRGIAEAVDTIDEGAADIPSSSDNTVSYLEEYSFKELQKIAKDKGLSGAGSKAEIISRILDAENCSQSVDGSEPPILTAQEPV